MSTAQTSEEYGQMVNDIIGKSFVASMISMAYELGILKLLTDTQKPMTSHEIADAKNLKERYVREAMNCLACASVVGVNKDVKGQVRYNLTPEQGEVIRTSMMIGLMSSQFTRYLGMMDRFKKDGPYDFPFNEDKMAMAGTEQVCVPRLGEEVELVLSVIPGLKEQLESGIKAVECGSGTGLFLTTFAEKFPNSHFVGSDVTEVNIQRLQDKCRSLNLTHVDIRKLDVLNVPDDLAGHFDFAICNDVIHDLPDPQKGLRGMRKLLKPGSYFAMFDIDGHSDVTVNKANPTSAGLYAVSAFYCVAQAYRSEDSIALGACWGRDVAMEMIEKAGFKIESIHPHSGCFILYVCKVD